MNKTKSEEPIVLRVNTIADGKFYMAGSETPFTKSTLPEHLRPDVAVGDEPPFFDHAERLIYDGRPDYGEPATLYRFLDGQGPGNQETSGAGGLGFAGTNFRRAGSGIRQQAQSGGRGSATGEARRAHWQGAGSGAV